ncbi:MAG: Fe-S cluster assembly ATPase SufC [Planctomycetes bacterium]|nr:Fe-S cluster assembly ATPase SufC [Planctomycetota bacterium]MCW8136315.1 Fe-S cluster assembly ATPase SufC [Planctomycetota bacterium]
MLEIKDLHVSIGGTEIIHGIDLSIGAGEVHAIMGTNGSGKSTLTKAIAGHPDYEITRGDILLKGKSILADEPEDRARAGIFLAFQYPVEIPGVSNMYFLRAALNAQRKARGEAEVSGADFLALIKEKAKLMDIDAGLLNRSVNEGFSGGEKKRNEILQLAVLEPTLAVLDETDSGLDIDALKTVANGVNSLRDSKRSFLLVTHYQRLLNHIKPDFVHVLLDGRLVKSGGPELALELEEKGYAWLEQTV